MGISAWVELRGRADPVARDVEMGPPMARLLHLRLGRRRRRGLPLEFFKQMPLSRPLSCAWTLVLAALRSSQQE